MRKLQTQDVFKAIKVVNQTGIKDVFKDFTTKEGNIDVQEVGFEIIFNLLEKATGTQAEQSIYEFLAGPLEKTAKEVKEMDLLEMVKEITECADVENWKSFFKSVSVLTMK